MTDISQHMRPPPGARWLFRAAGFGLTLTLAAYFGLMGLLARPDPLFTHQAGRGAVTFHSTSPLPPETPDLAQAVLARLSASLLGAPTDAIDVWLVDERWPVAIFFAGSQRAAGLTYPVLSTRNVFLRHADIPANRLSPGGRAVPAPRSLTYFVTHEAAHLMVAERVGRLRAAQVPRWVHEGVADLAALGPATPEVLRAVATGRALPTGAFGTYAEERICAMALLADHGGDLDAVLAHRAAMPAPASCALDLLPIAPEAADT